MREEMLDVMEYCEECGEETKMKFVERDEEYLVYECSVCGSQEEFLEENLKNDIEEEIV